MPLKKFIKNWLEVAAPCHRVGGSSPHSLGSVIDVETNEIEIYLLTADTVDVD